MKSLISTRDLSLDQLEEILTLTQELKRGKRLSCEGDVALLFLEPSTRTRISFEKACKSLGLNTYVVSASNSSLTKGESFFDTLKTFEALGFKGVVFRVPFVFYPYREVVDSLKLSLINAGDGTHQHPTQGLIDVFTLREEFKTLEGLKVLYVGDILHSRVFRSGVALLNMMGAEVSLCGPAPLIPRDISSLGVSRVFSDLDEALEWADAVIWLRLQKERQAQNFVPSERSYFEQFGLTHERHKKLRGKFLHPGPVNREVDIAGELIYSEKSLIQKQVENGLWVRSAVLRWCLE